MHDRAGRQRVDHGTLKVQPPGVLAADLPTHPDDQVESAGRVRAEHVADVVLAAIAVERDLDDGADGSLHRLLRRMRTNPITSTITSTVELTAPMPTANSGQIMRPTKQPRLIPTTRAAVAFTRDAP
jgi:hypothetical protein